MKRSEIFENFIKIAEEKGLISDKATQKKIKHLEESRSHEYRSPKEIDDLYNIKSNKKYKKNIIEIAHPEPVVVSPSYDKLNGLVENENERQNITLNIINKRTRGIVTNHKHAQDKLTINLLKLGNSLDNSNEEDLAKLSDICLQQITKKANPLLIAGIAAAAVGALWLQQHLPNVNQGFIINYNRLTAELDELISGSAEYGLGYSYRPEFIKQMVKFKSELQDIAKLYNDKVTIINELERPKNAKEMYEIANQPETHTATEAYKILKDKFFNVYAEIKTVIKNFSSSDYKERQIIEKGAITSIVDRAKIFHGGNGLIADDFDDVKNALIPFSESFSNIIKLLSESDSIEKKTAADLSEAATSYETEINQTKQPVKTDSPEQDDDIKSQVADLMKQFPNLV